MFDVDPPWFSLINHHGISGMGMVKTRALPGAGAGGRSSDFAGHGGDIAGAPCRGSTGAAPGEVVEVKRPGYFTYHKLVQYYSHM